MNPGQSSPNTAGLLIDSNLLVLFVVGRVSPNRIERFKRTRQYSEADYELLLRVIEGSGSLYTLPHVLAEVSNLTDLAGEEGRIARQILKEMVTVLREPALPSIRAAECRHFERLGLVDAAILVAAREYNCVVLTADLDLYLALISENLPAHNFAHLQEAEFGI